MSRFRSKLSRLPPPGTPIDWQNPITRGLTFVFRGDDWGGGLVYPRNISPAYYDRQAASSPYGPAFTSDGTNGKVRFANTDIDLAHHNNNVTPISIFHRTGTPDSYSRLFNKTANNGNSPFENWGIEIATAGVADDVQAVAYAGSFQASNVVGGTSLGRNLFACRMSAGNLNANAFDGYGQHRVTNTGGLTFQEHTTGNHDTIIAGKGDETTTLKNIGVTILLNLFYDRHFHVEEMWELWRDPFQIFIQEPKIMFLLPAIPTVTPAIFRRRMEEG